MLVVDDEPAVRQALDRALRFEGYQTEAAEDGPSALGAHAERPADAIVLDVAMPRMDGLEVCRRLRQAGDHTPVLMLTARAAVNDRVAGLDAGADDYLVKPFALEELLARIRALLRRSAPAGDDEVLRFADLSLDPGTREVRRGNRSMELTRTEFLLLELLLRNARQVLPRELIFDRVWGYDFGANSNSLEVYIGYLRRKTEAGGEPRLIHTVRGVGYVLRQPSRRGERRDRLAAAPEVPGPAGRPGRRRGRADRGPGGLRHLPVRAPPALPPGRLLAQQRDRRPGHRRRAAFQPGRVANFFRQYNNSLLQVIDADR